MRVTQHQDESPAPATPLDRPHPGNAAEVFFAFLRLGLTSFGGPIAHLGYFRREFVERRRWLDDRSFSDLVALCQFLPGPASSQVGMALGVGRAGWLGAFLAWLGFTAPSAAALMVFALGVGRWDGLAASHAIHGFKIAAVAVVAQAVWGMAKSLCPDRTRAFIAIFAAVATLAWPDAWAQVTTIVASGLAGWLLLKLPHQLPAPHRAYGVTKRAGCAALCLFFLLLLGLPAVAAGTGSSMWALVEGFYRAGALVFGGGHVVLPLLQSTVVPVGAVSNAQFMAGYGAAQAVPGPLFSFAAYLGTVMQGPLQGWAGGLVFLCILYLPAFLLVIGALPFWDALRQRDAIQAAMGGINAGVVGLLLSALYDPVWTSAIHRRTDFAIAVVAFGVLMYTRASPFFVVCGAAASAWLLLG